MPKIIHAYWNVGTFRKILAMRKGDSLTVRYRYKPGYPITKMILKCEWKEEELR